MEKTEERPRGKQSFGENHQVGSGHCRNRNYLAVADIGIRYRGTHRGGATHHRRICFRYTDVGARGYTGMEHLAHRGGAAAVLGIG